MGYAPNRDRRINGMPIKLSMTQAGPCLVRFALRFADTYYNQSAYQGGRQGRTQAEHERASHTPSPLHPIPLTASQKTTGHDGRDQLDPSGRSPYATASQRCSVDRLGYQPSFVIISSLQKQMAAERILPHDKIAIKCLVIGHT